MSHEKKPAHTCWDPACKTWLIYLLPEAQVPYLTIELDLQRFQGRILENPTFQKFCERLGGNLKAIEQMKTQTQQREGGYRSQMASTTTLTIMLWLLNTLNPIFLYARYITPDKKSDGSSNPSRDRLETAALWTFIFLNLLQAILMLSFFYTTLLRTDSEKKQNKFFELMRDILKRKPLIELEIQDKEETISLLNDFLNIGEIEILPLTRAQVPLNALPHFQAIKEKKEKLGIPKIDFEQIERGDIEAGRSRGLTTQADSQASLLDLIKTHLDADNDLTVYHNLRTFLKSLRSNLSDQTDRQLNEIVLCLIKILIVVLYPTRTLPIPLQEILQIGSFNQLIGYCNRLFELASGTQMSLGYVVAEQLVKLMKDKNLLFAANEIINLLAAANVSTNIHSPNQANNLLFVIYTHCSMRWQSSKFKSEFLHRYLQELKPQQYDRVISYIKSKLNDPKDTRHISVKIIEIIEELANKTRLREIIGLSVGSTAPFPLPPHSTVAPVKTKDDYFGTLEVSKLIKCHYQNHELTFEVYKTLGDGRCGYYSLPIPYDHEGVKNLLLKNINDKTIRKMLAHEMLETLHTPYFPEKIFKEFDQLLSEQNYLIQHDTNMQRLLSGVNEILTAKGIKIADRQFDNVISHLQALKSQDPEVLTQLQKLLDFKRKHEDRVQAIIGYLSREDVCKYYIKNYLGSGGELSFSRGSINFTQEKGLLDAILHVAKPPIHLVIWQSDERSNRGTIVYEGGPEGAPVTHIHHRPGKDTHFELMAETTRTPAKTLEDTIIKGAARAASTSTLFTEGKVKQRTPSSSSSPVIRPTSSTSSPSVSKIPAQISPATPKVGKRKGE